MGRSARPGDYDAIADPYCYPDTTVFKNIPDIRDAAALAEFEAVITAQRADEPLPVGRLSIRQRIRASMPDTEFNQQGETTESGELYQVFTALSDALHRRMRETARRYGSSEADPLLRQLLGNIGGDLPGLGKVGLGAGSVALPEAGHRPEIEKRRHIGVDFDGAIEVDESLVKAALIKMYPSANGAKDHIVRIKLDRLV